MYRLHKRNGDQRGDFDPRGGRLPTVTVAERPPSPSARGLGGVAYVSFRVRPGTAEGIAGFYREVFGAEVEEVGGGGGGGGDGGCAADGGGSSEEMSCSATVSAATFVPPWLLELMFGLCLCLVLVLTVVWFWCWLGQWEHRESVRANRRRRLVP